MGKTTRANGFRSHQKTRKKKVSFSKEKTEIYRIHCGFHTPNEICVVVLLARGTFEKKHPITSFTSSCWRLERERKRQNGDRFSKLSSFQKIKNTKNRKIEPKRIWL